MSLKLKKDWGTNEATGGYTWSLVKLLKKDCDFLKAKHINGTG